MTLHWHTAENPCLLCGVPVTPEAWAGGIVELAYTRIEGNSWIITAQGYKAGCECSTCQDTAAGRPIFPPRGWAGKTDAELWREVFGASGFAVLLRYDWDWGGRQHYREVRVNQSGGIMEMAPGDMGAEYGSLNTFSWLDADNLARVILALQNAQVLAKRLQEAQP